MSHRTRGRPIVGDEALDERLVVMIPSSLGRALRKKTDNVPALVRRVLMKAVGSVRKIPAARRAKDRARAGRKQRHR